MDLEVGKAEQLIACPRRGSIDTKKTEVCDFTARKKAYETAIVGGICENVGKFSTLVSSCMRQRGGLVRLSENSTRVICDSPENSVTDIDQRICPTVMQTCANVPSEECEDALPSC